MLIIEGRVWICQVVPVCLLLQEAHYDGVGSHPADSRESAVSCEVSRSAQSPQENLKSHLMTCCAPALTVLATVRSTNAFTLRWLIRSIQARCWSTVGSFTWESKSPTVT